jgi:uncharacterized protein YfdQ (DUF2303 family)
MSETNFQAAFEAGQTASPERVIYSTGKGHPYLVIPENAQLESLEKLLPQPLMKRQTVSFTEPKSFARYITEHAGPTTAIFAKVGNDGGFFNAVLDYHQPKGEPSWCAHRATYDCPHDPVFRLWLKENNQWKAQREFAEFIESNTAQIREPSAAEFLEVAQTLTARTQVSFIGTTRLDSGRDQVAFESTSETKAGEKGNLQLPAIFKVQLVVFDGSAPWLFQARLRHRINEQKKLELKYELVNPQITIRAAWDELVKAIADATKLQPYLGSC